MSNQYRNSQVFVEVAHNALFVGGGTKYYDMARMYSSTAGTTTAVVLTTAVPGYATLSAAGVSNGALITYGIQDGANYEVGRGLYYTSGPTIIRTKCLSSSNSNAFLSLSGSEQIFITQAAEDIVTQLSSLGDVDASIDGATSAGGILVLAQDTTVTPYIWRRKQLNTYSLGDISYTAAGAFITGNVPTANALLAWNSTAGAWVPTQMNVSSMVTGVLPVANGGTGTAVPGLVAGTGISVTGSWPNQTITNTGSWALSGLTDVNVTEGLSIDGYSLVWNNATSKWIASKSSGGGSGTLAGDSDVSILSPANGQVLTYHSGAWINANGAGSTVTLDKDRFAPPLATDFPTLLSTNSTNPNVYWTNTTGLTLGSGVNFAAGDNVRMMLKTLPSGNWTVTARIKVMTRGIAYTTGALVLRDSSSGKFIGFGYDAWSVTITHWNSSTSFNSTVWHSNQAGTNIDMRQGPEWFQIHYDGTNLNFLISQDGTNWILLYQELLTAFTPSLNQVGFQSHVNHNDSQWNNPSSGDQAFTHVLYYNDNSLLAASRTIQVGSNNPALAVLPDVNVTEGSTIDGYFLTFQNSSGKWIASRLKSQVFTVATLPSLSSGDSGTRAAVSDASSPTFLGALTGGGATFCPVVWSGTAWVAG